MEVTVAKSAGFCFGVKRAVGLAYEEAASKSPAVYTLGPIIHNEFVVDDLATKGVHVIDDNLYCEAEKRKPPKGSVIIIRSHGIGRSLYEKIRSEGYRTVDATCPFVQKIHDIVRKKSADGTPVIIIGNPNHPEVCGIRGWGGDDCCVVENAEDVANIPYSKADEICIVSQTTFNFQKFQELVEIIERLGYHIHVTNTICNATRERQEEALELAGRSDAMIVIGGRASSNTQKLYDICRSRCEATYFVQSQDDLKHIKIESDSCVGITAGASTPNNIIQEVSLNVSRTEFWSDV